MRWDLIEIKSDIALLENKTLTAQTEILSLLHRIEQSAAPATEQFEDVPPSR